MKQAIASNLRDSITGVQVLEYVSDQVVPPAIDIRRGLVDYDQALHGGTHRWTMLVRAFVATVTDKSAQARLDSYLDPDGGDSVKAAIESDRTLGGLVADLQVKTATGEQTYTIGQLQLVGSEWTVEIWL